MKKLEIYLKLCALSVLVQLCVGNLDEDSLNFRREAALLRNQRPIVPVSQAEHIETPIQENHININHMIDYLHTLRRSNEQMNEKIAELTKKLEARDQEDSKYRGKFATKLQAVENKVSFLEQSMPLKPEDLHQNAMPIETDTPKRTRDLNSFVHLAEAEQKFIPVNKIVEESRRSIEIFNSTLENFKQNITSMEDQFLRFNETHTNEIQTVVNFESQIENKLESSCQEIDYLRMKHHELNYTVDLLVRNFLDVANKLHEESARIETKVMQTIDGQKLITVKLRKQFNDFKTTIKHQIQNISSTVGSLQTENKNSSAFSLLIDQVHFLQEQVNSHCNNCRGIGNLRTKSLSSPVAPPEQLLLGDDIDTIKQDIQSNKAQITDIAAQLNKVNVSQILILRTMDDETLKKRIRPKDCSEIRLLRNSSSGVYTIYPGRDDQKPLEVICDLDTDGGGWTVIQRRGTLLSRPNETREDFFRDWSDYEKGFGKIDKDFWIGLSNMAAICQLGTQELRIELSDWKGEKRYASYKNFRIADWSDLYRLQISDYSGTAGDSLSRHNGMAFSTWDRDNDIDFRRNCAHSWRGAWWYYSCHESNLNGLYAKEGSNGTHEFGTGIVWYSWTANYYSLKTVEIKIRNMYILH